MKLFDKLKSFLTGHFDSQKKVVATYTAVPAPPTRLKARVGTNGEVYLSWDEHSAEKISWDFNGYHISRKGKLHTNTDMVGSTNHTRFIDADVKPGQTYRYVVTVIIGRYESEPSNEVTVTVK